MIFTRFRISIAIVLFLLLVSNTAKSQVILSAPDNPDKKVTAPGFIQLKPGFKVAAQNNTFYHAFIDSNGDGIPDELGSSGSIGGGEIEFSETPYFTDTKGELSVTAMGSANYTLPVALPPGIKNIAPQIALVYNSSSDNGIVGYGGSLKGISSISRISSRLDIDGFVGGVKFNSDDRFSLDGQRLILDKGTYGAAGSTYKTENYSNLRIEAIGNTAYPGIEGTGPESFKVTFPDGTQVFYGSSFDARGVTEWLIKKWKDPQGNYIEYFYDKDQNTTYINRIVWAVNENINTGYSNTIRFFYKQRERPEFAYIQGLKLTNNRILDKIEVYTADKLFRKYQINYKIIGGSYQRMESLQEFNGANEAANPVTFSYNDTSNSFGGYIYDKSDALRNLKDVKLTGDFDGDGEVDVVVPGFMYKGIMSNLGRGDGNIIPVNTSKLVEHPITTLTYGKMNNFQSLVTYDNEAPDNIPETDPNWENRNKLVFHTFNYNPSSNKFEPVYTKKMNYPYVGLTVDNCSNMRYLAGKGWVGNSTITYDNSRNDYKFLEGDFNGDGISELIVLGKILRSTIDIVIWNTPSSDRDDGFPSHIEPIETLPDYSCEANNGYHFIEPYYIDMNPNIPDE